MVSWRERKKYQVIFLSLLNKVLPGYGKKIGEEGFDLGTEVIRQGVNLKLSGVERLTDKLIEEKENIRSNQNEN